jgi:hypothetical protein
MDKKKSTNKPDVSAGRLDITVWAKSAGRQDITVWAESAGRDSVKLEIFI